MTKRASDLLWERSLGNVSLRLVQVKEQTSQPSLLMTRSSSSRKGSLLAQSKKVSRKHQCWIAENTRVAPYHKPNYSFLPCFWVSVTVHQNHPWTVATDTAIVLKSGEEVLSAFRAKKNKIKIRIVSLTLQQNKTIFIVLPLIIHSAYHTSLGL